MSKISRHGDEVRKQIMDYLKEAVEPIAPVSYSEIAKAIGVSSTNTVEYHLKKLQEAGRIDLVGFRNIRVKGE